MIKFNSKFHTINIISKQNFSNRINKIISNEIKAIHKFSYFSINKNVHLLRYYDLDYDQVEDFHYLQFLSIFQYNKHEVHSYNLCFVQHIHQMPFHLFVYNEQQSIHADQQIWTKSYCQYQHL